MDAQRSLTDTDPTKEPLETLMRDINMPCITASQIADPCKTDTVMFGLDRGGTSFLLSPV